MKRLIIGLVLVMLLLVPVACASTPSVEESAEEAMPTVISPGTEEVYKEAGQKFCRQQPKSG